MSTFCPSCGTQVHGRFCPACGTPISAPGRGGRPNGPWLILGGVLILALIFSLGLLVGRRNSAAPAPAPAEQAQAPFAGGGTGPAPDISNLSPRERFDRLFNKVMQASANGDAATMTQFAPMAIAAYGMLDSTDVDAQYDVALLKLHTGDIAGAKLMADSMIRAHPKHLFGLMVRATAARFSGDSATARTAQAAFLRNYPDEIRRNRPEYAKHQSSLDAFKQQIQATP